MWVLDFESVVGNGMKSFPVSQRFAAMLVASGLPEGWRVAEDPKSPRGWRLYSPLVGREAKRAFNRLFFEHYEYKGLVSSARCSCCDELISDKAKYVPKL